MPAPMSPAGESLPAALAGERLDRVVALVTGRTRAEAAAAVDAGDVRVDGRVVTARARRMRAGERLDVVAPEAAPADGPAGDPSVVVTVVYEDDDLVVVDKPAGLVVHPGPGHATGTLVHGLLARYPDLAAGDAARPGIVHRLDKGTSGLMVVARSAPAYDELVTQLAARRVERLYTALVLGRVEADQGVVDAPLGRSGRDPTRVAVSAGGRAARTHYRVEDRFERPVAVTQLQCRLETGRTHQIRVHLAAIGHPVVGDARYGRPGGWRPLGGERPFLHAGSLRFEHPRTGEPLSLSSPLPTDLAGVLAQLRRAGAP